MILLTVSIINCYFLCDWSGSSYIKLIKKPRSFERNWFLDFHLLKLPIFSFVTVVLRADLQQPVFYIGMQEQRGMCDKQEEPNRVQSVPATEVRPRRNVQIRLTVREKIQLVQNPLSATGAAATAYSAHADKQVSPLFQLFDQLIVPSHKPATSGRFG